ncbi:uncharacterized protein ACIQIH_003777 isoform 2-T2 [Cyanocitta cristata]
MHAWGRSPPGSITEPPPDAPHGPADGWDIARGRGGVVSAPLRDSYVTPPAVVSSGFLSAEPAPSSGQSRFPAPAALQPLGFAPSLPPHCTSARHHHPQLLRWRDVWRESERRPSTGGWPPALSPTI